MRWGLGNGGGWEEEREWEDRAELRGWGGGGGGGGGCEERAARRRGRPPWKWRGLNRDRARFVVAGEAGREVRTGEERMNGRRRAETFATDFPRFFGRAFDWYGVASEVTM